MAIFHNETCCRNKSENSYQFLEFTSGGESTSSMKSNNYTMDTEFLSERMHFLESAYMNFILHPVPPSEGSSEFELKCKDLQNDILKHESFWFDVILKHDLHAEKCIAMLNTLTSIMKRKGFIENAYKTLKLSGSILKVYNENTFSKRDLAQNYCYKVLMYKHNLLSFNVNTQLENSAEAIKAFRDAVTYEINDTNGVETQNWSLILPILFGPDYMNLTAQELNEVKDDEIWYALNQSIDDPLMRCGNCGVKEKKQKCVQELQ